MKKPILILFLQLIGIITLHAQIFYTENFNTTSWTLNTVYGAEGSDPNFFTISDNEGGVLPPGCGVANNGNNTLHVTSVFAPTAGASYDAGGLCGILTCPQTNRGALSPTINCSGYSTIQLSFDYIENGDGSIDNASAWYFNGSTWSLLDDMPKTLICSTLQGQWAARTVNLPSSANNNPNVRIAFRWVNNDDGAGSDPSFAVDNVTLTATPSTIASITTAGLSSTNYCSCATTTVSFTATGVYNAGNMYTAQLSDAAGSFASPVTIGNLSSTANTGTITVTIPCTTPLGSGYRIRVVSSNPAVTGSNNGSNLTLTPSSTPGIIISSPFSSSVCAGATVTFQATTTNSGTNPTYQWLKNGSPVGSSSPAYTTNTLATGDIIQCMLTSTLPCASPQTVMSNSVTALISPNPVIIAIATPSTSICSGTTVALGASGGASYTWSGGVINGLPFVPLSTTTYTVTGTSSAGCTGTSAVTITVTPLAATTVSISSAPNPVYTGQNVTYTANTGTATNYLLQWYKAGVLATTTANPVNSYTTLIASLADSVYAIVTPQGCFAPSTLKSNVIIPLQAVSSPFSEAAEISLYPNPTTQTVQIKGCTPQDEITVYNMFGQLVIEPQLVTTDPVILDLHQLSKGTYWIQIKNKKQTFEKKVVVY